MPSTLHQYLIQWLVDEVEIVHGDTSACVAVADSPTMSDHENLKCLSGLDLSECEIIGCTKDGFAAAVMRPIGDQAKPPIVI